MKTGTHVFLLSLFLFASGTTAIAYGLAKDAAKPTGRNPPPLSIPWYCVKYEPPTQNSDIKIPPPGIKGNSIQPIPTITIDTNPGKNSRSAPVPVIDRGRPQKITPPSWVVPPPKKTPPTTTPGYTAPGTGTSGYYSNGGNPGTPGGSTITKNGGSNGVPGSAGYYANDGTDGVNRLGGGIKIGPTDDPSDTGIWNPAPWGKTVEMCPLGYYPKNLWEDCYQLLQKKLTGGLSEHDKQTPLFKVCSELIKPTAWNSEVNPAMCAAFKKYSQQCTSSKGASCPLQSFLDEAGIPIEKLQKTLKDANNYCWIF